MGLETQPVKIVPPQFGRQGNGFYERKTVPFTVNPNLINPLLTSRITYQSPLFDCNYEKDSKSQNANAMVLPYSIFYRINFTILNFAALFVASRRNMGQNVFFNVGDDPDDMTTTGTTGLWSSASNLANTIFTSSFGATGIFPYYSRFWKVSPSPRFFSIGIELTSEVDTINAETAFNIELGEY